jgi:TP901 family phage tail tape measure protein
MGGVMAGQATIATAYVQLVPTLEGVQGTVGEAFGDVDKQAEEHGKKTGSKWGGALTAAAGVAAGAAAVGGAALAGLYKIGATFDDVSDGIQIATGKTGAQLAALTDSAKVVGSTVPVQFDKIAPALSAVSTRLGLTGGDLETVTSQFLALGDITGKDLNMDQATAAFNAFGVTGADVSTQMDNLLKVSQATGTGIDDITGSIQKSAPALQQLGFNFESSAALVGQLDKAGINSQSVLGGMGKALVKLSKDGEAPQEAFQRVTGQIGDLVKSGDDAKAIDLASTLFGTKGAAQFVEATKNGTLNVDAMTQALNDNQTTILGTAEDTADFAEQWQLFKNKALVALEPVGSAVFGLAGTLGGKLNDAFDVIVPAATALFKLFQTGDFQGGIFGLEEDSPIISGLLTFRDLVKDIVPILGGAFKSAWDTIGPILEQVGTTIGGALVDVFKELWPSIKDLVPIVLQLFTVFNPVSLIFKTLLPQLPQIATVFATLARTIGGVLQKTLAIIVPMLGRLVSIIFPQIQKLIRAVLPFVLSLVKIIGELASVIGDALGKALDALTPLFDTLVGIIGELIPYVSDLITGLLPPLQSAFEALVPLVQAVLDVIISLASAIIDALIPVIESLLPIVKTVFGFIADTIANIVQVFHGLIDIVTGIFTGDWEKVWTGAKEIFSGVWDQIKNIFGTLWTVIVEFFSGVVPAIWNVISGFASFLIDRGGELLGWLWDGIKAGFAQLLDWAGQFAGWVWDKIVAFAGWLGDRGVEFIHWVSDGIVTGAQAIWDFFTALPGNIWDIFMGFERWLGDRIWEFIHWFSTGIVNGAQAIWDFFTALPQNIWNIFLGFETWLGDRMWEFMGWLAKGITDGASAIWNYFTGGIDDPNSFLGGLWAAVKTLTNDVIDIGKTFVGWIVEGVTSVASDIWNAITDALTGDATKSVSVPGVSPSSPNRLGKAAGGLIAKAAGGPIFGPGGPRDDLIPLWGSNGEFMVNAAATRKHLALIEAINADGYASGGMLGTRQTLRGRMRMLSSLASRLSVGSCPTRRSRAITRAREPSSGAGLRCKLSQRLARAQRTSRLCSTRCRRSRAGTRQRST